MFRVVKPHDQVPLLTVAHTVHERYPDLFRDDIKGAPRIAIVPPITIERYIVAAGLQDKKAAVYKSLLAGLPISAREATIAECRWIDAYPAGLLAVTVHSRVMDREIMTGHRLVDEPKFVRVPFIALGHLEDPNDEEANEHVINTAVDLIADELPSRRITLQKVTEGF